MWILQHHFSLMSNVPQRLFSSCYICPQNLGYSEVTKSVGTLISLVTLEVESQNFANMIPSSKETDTNHSQPVYHINSSGNTVSPRDSSFSHPPHITRKKHLKRPNGLSYRSETCQGVLQHQYKPFPIARNEIWGFSKFSVMTSSELRDVIKGRWQNRKWPPNVKATV